MAYQQGRYDPNRQTDEFGNPMGQSGGEYVNPVRQGQTTGLYGTGIGGAGGEAGSYGLGGTGQGQQQRMHQGGSYGLGGGMGQGQQQRMEGGRLGEGGGGVLHRSGSGSSSSSEDDGQGGRRKKGLKEKIKEKIPGVGSGMTSDDPHQQAGYGTTTGTAGGYGSGEPYQSAGTGQQHEKKGMMEKIKEKLPGHH